MIETILLPNYQIREASSKDTDIIAKIHYQCWRESYQQIIDPIYSQQRSYQDTFNDHQSKLENPQNLYLVALYQGQVIGFCSATSLKIHDNQNFSPQQLIQWQKANDQGEIDNLYILQQYQRKRIGRCLLSKAADWLRRNQLIPFLIWTFKENHKARQFYESQGGDYVDEIWVTIGGKNYKEVAYRFR